MLAVWFKFKLLKEQQIGVHMQIKETNVTLVQGSQQ